MIKLLPVILNLQRAAKKGKISDNASEYCAALNNILGLKKFSVFIVLIKIVIHRTYGNGCKIKY